VIVSFLFLLVPVDTALYHQIQTGTDFCLPAGAIVGIVVGLVVLTAFTIILLWCYKERRLPGMSIYRKNANNNIHGHASSQSGSLFLPVCIFQLEIGIFFGACKAVALPFIEFSNLFAKLSILGKTPWSSRYNFLLGASDTTEGSFEQL
jgi:hypothetical protein